MPGYRGHDGITFACSAAAGVAAFYLRQEPWTIVALVSATILGGCLFTPDLDTNSMAFTRWGPFACLWRPYEKIMPHRHFLSHGWIALVSTAVRVVYFVLFFLIIPALILWTAIHFDKNQPLDLPGFQKLMTGTLVGIYGLAPPRMWATIFLGLWLGAFAHTGADSIVSGFKRLFGRRGKKHRPRPAYRRVS